MNRILRIAAISASLLALLGVGAAPTEAAFPGRNGAIAFRSGDHALGIAGDIYVYDADGTNLAALGDICDPPATATVPGSSPDGTHVAYLHCDSSELRVRRLASDHEGRQIAQGGGRAGRPTAPRSHSRAFPDTRSS